MAATRKTSESLWRRIFLAPVRAGGIALFVAMPFAGTAISHFIDCGDAFWSVACGVEAPAAPASPGSTNANETQSADLEPADEVLGITVIIDSAGDPTCRTLDNGFIVCNS